VPNAARRHLEEMDFVVHDTVPKDSFGFLGGGLVALAQRMPIEARNSKSKHSCFTDGEWLLRLRTS